MAHLLSTWQWLISSTSDDDECSIERLMMASFVSSQRLGAFVARFVTVHPHEMPTLLHACASFFFLLSAYFMVIPFRDEAAISLGTDVLPMLFIASLLLTLIAAPISSHLLSLPFQSKSKALLIMYRFFGASLILFFLLYALESVTTSSISTKGDLSMMLQSFKLGIQKEDSHQTFIGLRVCFYIWIALLNLFTTSALWARLADIMTSEVSMGSLINLVRLACTFKGCLTCGIEFQGNNVQAGSRLFGFVGAGATLGQLAGSILAVVLAPFGSFLLLVSAVFMELGARCALGIGEDHPFYSSTPSSDSQSNDEVVQIDYSLWEAVCSKVSATLEGLRLILASSYLLHVCCFLWLTAVVSSFFYFQRANVVAGVTHDPLGRRMLLAKINSFTAVFILFGQLTITGRLLTYFGVTIALCASPAVAFFNMAAISISPIPLVIAVSEASRKVTTYVLTKPGREVLFTVISHEEKYKAKVFIDTFVQRLGDAAAAGIYELIGILLPMDSSTVAVCALPVCFAWFLAALTLGRRQQTRAQSLSMFQEIQ